MIDPNESVYYLMYAGAVAVLGVLYVKVKSTEAMVITTKEFKSFQWSFLVAYSLVTLGETVAAASFYVTLMHAHVPLEQITTMYVVTVASTTFFNSFLDIVDIGTRKNKCTLSALLFAGSMFTLFFTEHEGLYLLGRVAYGAAYSLLNSAFNSYLVQQHTTMGFPDDWLAHTFTVLTHTMAAVTAASGILGQVASSSGTFGCVTVSMFLFAAAALYMTGAWEGDFAGPRFMLSNFTFSMGQTLRSLQSNPGSLYCVTLSGLAEGAILIILFYWAPWLREVVHLSGGAEAKIPDVIVYSCYLVATIIGTYLAQIYARDLGEDMLLQTAMVGASVCFFTGATVSSPGMVFATTIGANLCIGAYWALINVFRNKYLVSDWRDGSVALSRMLSAALCIGVLNMIHHSSMLTLMACAALMAGATYFHHRTASLPPLEEEEDV